MAEFSNPTGNSDMDYHSQSSRASTEEDESMEQDLRIIVVGNQCHNNTCLQNALQCHFSSAVVLYSDTGFEYMTDTDDDTVFVVENFDGDIFQQLRRGRCRILGPPVIIKCARDKERLPSNQRPLYCTTMNQLILCFTGFKVKEDLSRLADLIHHMGGSIRKDFSFRITHLVANCTSGDKFRTAVSMGTPIMHMNWVLKTWELCSDIDASATDEKFMCHKLSPFYFSTLSFLGFCRDEQRHMEEVTFKNGGTCAEAGAPTCTHLVVAEHSVKTILFETHPKLLIVKSEWFWASIQMDVCADESLYTFVPVVEEVVIGNPVSVGTPCSVAVSKSRKRKRLKENLAQLASEGEVNTPMFKRRSNEVARMSFGASFLDTTADTSATPNQVITDYDLETGGHVTPCSGKSTPSSRHGTTTPGSSSGCHLVAAVKESRTSRRLQIVLELFQTEKNYVGILHTILKVFKEEIERSDQPGGPILDPPTVKIIFGEIPPIYSAHIKMRDELNELVNNWREESLVGDVFLRHADALTKCYPPFVNYFTNTKETLRDCDRNLPRFHAFLKVCQTRQECGRQSLTELLIRPVQRLPSVLLILKEMLKRTEEKNLDYRQLEKAISALEEVMTHINEDKRKTECHQTMFDIINDIENCPPNLLSSHRAFVTRVDVVELTDELSGRGDPLSLFVFSDSLELCKRRVKVLNSSKTATPHGAKTPQKAFKHIEVMQLSSIKRVVDIVNSADGDCKNVFALVTKKMNEEERRYAFALVDEGVRKIDFLTTLSKTICNSTCRADYETLLTTVDSQTLSIDTTEVGSRHLINRFSKRVSRAFSFNKTPRKLKRAMSSMTQLVSPRHRDLSSASINPYLLSTPSSEFKAIRLATELTVSDTSPHQIIHL